MPRRPTIPLANSGRVDEELAAAERADSRNTSDDETDGRTAQRMGAQE